MKDKRALVVLLCLAAAALVFAAPAAGGTEAPDENPFVVVLGVVQDGGYPQAGCKKECCARVWEDFERRHYVSCIAVVDPQTKQRWIVDATPDFKEQLRLLDRLFPVDARPGIDGIFLTHAHMGHYTGLMHLGREVMGTNNVPVFALPRMYQYLSTNGPWDQLVRLENIALREVQDGMTIQLNERVSVTPFLVPHRDEYTETAGYRIDGPNGSAIYISDIDKWDRWDVSIVELLSEVSVAYLDATFYAEGEIPGRSMADIPHPFIQESMELFGSLPAEEKAKIQFLHFNHTNPVLAPNGEARRTVEAAGYRIADELDVFEL
jgi:pyrroloquinoline quinone biosynthesis protein B